MKQLSYAEKLKSPKWQKKRLEILNLKGFKCEACGDEENQIQVHHRFYLKGREPWQYDNDVFQVLCEKCHEKLHAKDKQELIITLEEEKLLSLIREIILQDRDFYEDILFVLSEMKSDLFISVLWKDIVTIITIGDINKLILVVKELAELYLYCQEQTLENDSLKKIIDNQKNQLPEQFKEK